MRTENSTAVIEVRDLMEALSRFNPTDEVKILIRCDEEGEYDEDYEVFVLKVQRGPNAVLIHAIE